MKPNVTETTKALEHVDPKRRGFLAKMLAGSVALPVMSTVAFAAPQQDGKGKGKGGKGKGGQGQGGQGQGGQGKGKGKGQQGSGQMGDRDPAAVAKRMIQEFDKDGDQKLSLAELTMALKAMQERRAGGQAGQRGRGKGGAGGAQGAGKGKGGAGRGKGKGAGAEETIGGAGIKPKKPGQ
ncbi:MAG: EF-hand domain-containing protein [Planctomycetaceae bacterium]|nr:EF-hand domain-containing protein [Planctomycetaceae bacterium]